MRTLSVIEVEDGAILASDENGERFRIPVDESVRGRLVSSALPPGNRLSPREIQAQVRAGASVEEVAARTGAPVAHIQRFVRPVLAERAFVLESAMRVTVQPDADAEQASSFGAVIAERLASLDATEVSWTSLRQAGGDWIVCASFRADDVDHRARWTFDPKRLVLTPENIEASTLSQQGTPEALTPRLRVLDQTGPVAQRQEAPAETEPDRSRFDSAAFELPDLDSRAREQGPVEAAVLLDALARKRVERGSAAGSDPGPARLTATPSDGDATRPGATEALDATVPQGTVTHGRFPQPSQQQERQPEGGDEPGDEGPAEPEDLVALRRPRDRAHGPEHQQLPQKRYGPPHSSQSRGSQARHVELGPGQTRPAPVVAPSAAPRARRGRTSLPSWDEIVFGKADD